MNDVNKIISQIAEDTQAVIKVGSIIRCRYCRKYKNYEPLSENIWEINHESDCVWIRAKFIEDNKPVYQVCPLPIHPHTPNQIISFAEGTDIDSLLALANRMNQIDPKTVHIVRAK